MDETLATARKGGVLTNNPIIIMNHYMYLVTKIENGKETNNKVVLGSKEKVKEFIANQVMINVKITPILVDNVDNM
jgi:hypothetical protein